MSLLCLRTSVLWTLLVLHQLLCVSFHPANGWPSLEDPEPAEDTEVNEEEILDEDWDSDEDGKETKSMDPNLEEEAPYDCNDNRVPLHLRCAATEKCCKDDKCKPLGYDLESCNELFKTAKSQKDENHGPIDE